MYSCISGGAEVCEPLIVNTPHDAGVSSGNNSMGVRKKTVVTDNEWRFNVILYGVHESEQGSRIHT